MRDTVHHLGAALQGIADEHAGILTPRQAKALYEAASKLWDSPPTPDRRRDHLPRHMERYRDMTVDIVAAAICDGYSNGNVQLEEATEAERDRCYMAARAVMEIPTPDPATIEQAAREIETVARAICEGQGQDPDEDAPLGLICGPNNEQLPTWRFYEEHAESAILALRSRSYLRELLREQTDLVDRLCSAVERAENDIGGEGSLTVLRLLGPVNDRALAALKATPITTDEEELG